jgi:hypothetical protein
MHTCFAIQPSKILSESFLGFGVAQILLTPILTSIVFLGASAGIAAGMDTLSKPAVAETPAPAAATPGVVTAPISPVPPQPVVATPPLGKKDDVPPIAKKEAAAKTEPVVRSDSSLFLENRLSLGTSVGWAVVKPAKGTWVGLGASDISFQWRLSSDDSSPLSITGRYAPFAGVWTVNKRDYNVTAHGLYGGAEYRIPAGTATLRAGAELGYMLIYARAQDKTKLTSDVKGGKANLSLGGGADWKFASNKILIGPFARVHFVGFSIFNVGASARFVF